jgi:hypothetical protein
MSKKAGKARSDRIFRNLERLTQAEDAPEPSCRAEDEALDITSLVQQPIQVVMDTSKTLRMKKFRAQLLARWLVQNFAPCRALDAGGGKGLLSYLLIQAGWQATVVDPFDQPLPDKYKDIAAGVRVKIPPTAVVPRITAPLATAMGEDFDLLIGMHAHASNAKIIDAAEQFGCGFVLFPCCVIDEPFFPRLGVQWIEALADYAALKGLDIFPFRLNFKGQNIGICHPGKAKVRSV